MTYQTKHPPKLRFISAVLSLAMLLTLLPTTAFAAGDITYNQKQDGYTYGINHTKGYSFIDTYTGTEENVEIPETLGGYPVKRLTKCSFQQAKNMVSVQIPASVTEIGEGAFSDLKNLKNVTFAPESKLETIVRTAFSGSGVTTIELPDSLKTIGYGAFMNCHGLKSMTIPSGVETIGESAFINCRYLETISIPASVTSIGKSVFDSCSNLQTIKYAGTKEEWDALTKDIDLGMDVSEKMSFPEVTYTVKFDTNDPNFTIPDQTVLSGNYATEPKPIKDGVWYIACWCAKREWAENDEFDKKFDFASTPITKDITLYACWARTFRLYIGDVQVTTENQNDVLGDGKVQYDPDSDTLTLEDAEIHGDSTYNAAIRYPGTVPLTVTGTARLYGIVGVHANASDLNIENANLTFRTEATVEAVGEEGMNVGFTSRIGKMTIRDSTLKIAASGQGYCVYPYLCQGDLRIENSIVSVDDNVRCEYGLSSDTILTIDNSNVTIRNANVVAVRGGDNLTISGANTRIIAEINTDTSKYTPIWCKNSIDLQNGLEVLENTTQNGVKRMVVGNRANQVFAVMFAMNGHGKQEPAQQVKYGAPPVIPAYPEAEGWYFVGWYADEACTEAADFDLPIQKETTFYAKWDKMHTIHFELNGHGNEGYYNNDQEIRDGSALGELGLAWDDEWYFAGWFTDPALTTKVNPETIVTSDITCYAKWLKPEGITQYKVRFDLNASDAQWEQNFGSWGEWDDAHRVITAETYFDYDNENEQFVQLINVEPVIGYKQPERDGYTFKGWYTAPEGGEKMEEKYDVSMATMGYITEDLTFYAQWEKIGGEPSNPDKPTEPSKPEQPTEPSKPEQPTEPSNPDKPTEPSNPDKPTTPSEPGKDGGGAGAAILLAGGAALLGGIGYGVYTYITETQIKALLPEGTAIPANRGELAILLWNTAGRPEPAALPAFADVSDLELAKAAAWCIASGRMTAQEDGTFAPEQRMRKHQVLEVLEKAKDI